MRKRKFFTLFFALAAMMLASTGQIRADQMVYTHFYQGDYTQSPVTVNCGAVYHDYALLKYNKNLTVSVPAGYSITSIRFVVARAVEREIISTTKGTLSNNRPNDDAIVYVNDVNSTSVTLSTTEGEYRIEQIEVNYKVEVPVGAIDGLTGKNGSFRVWGWAFDPDAEDSYAVTIHVYVFDNATDTDLGKAKKGINAGTANIKRDDLASLGHGTMHGYDFNLSLTDLNPGTYYVRVYALDKQGISNPALTYSGDVSVKAATIGSPYTVSYNANNGTGAPGSQKKAQDITLKLSTTTPTRTGYTFNGWNTNNSGTGTNYAAGANYTANANVTLYAKWTAVNYTISYDLKGGSVSTNPTSYNIETNTITLNNPTKNGYTFKGWTGANGNTPQTSVQIAKGSTGNKTYTANWEKVTYTISYDYAGGSGFNVESYDVETATFQLAAPQRPGYNFLGWTGSNGNTPQMTVQIAKGSTGDKNYVAHWAINPNTNVVYLDSLDNTAAQETVAFNRPEAPEVAGFTFVRWDVVEGPLSEGIKLQAIYAENEPSGAPKKQVGKFTLTRKGDNNEYILQTAK